MRTTIRQFILSLSIIVAASLVLCACATAPTAVVEAPDGTVWCGTENGVASVRDGKVETVTQINGVPLDVVTACAVDRQEVLDTALLGEGTEIDAGALPADASALEAVVARVRELAGERGPTPHQP